MNQNQLRTLAQARILDAQALIAAGRWGYGYYVAGYAVECALKSCVLARMVHTGWVFEDKAKIEQCRVHIFGDLVVIAGMKEFLNDKLRESAAEGGEFVQNWNTVSKWAVESRYQDRAEQDAKELLAAITDDPHGVLKWIQTHW